MSWHACQIQAIALADDEDRPTICPRTSSWIRTTAPSGLALHFYLEYIVRRIEPSALGRDFVFWVAPATLIFDCLSATSGDLRAVCLPFEMRNPHRLTDGAARQGRVAPGGAA